MDRFHHRALSGLCYAIRQWVWLHAGRSEPWGATGRLPKPGQYCFEALQVAVYHEGQYFMAHEVCMRSVHTHCLFGPSQHELLLPFVQDGFPADVAQHNRFQRAATVLIYLCDVAHGGATVFEQLGVEVQPACGKALIFFPASADGKADSRSGHRMVVVLHLSCTDAACALLSALASWYGRRTLHTATDAIDTKWIAQQWIACGHGEAAGSSRAPVASPYPGRWEEDDAGSRARRSRKKSKGREAQSTGRGFGPR